MLELISLLGGAAARLVPFMVDAWKNKHENDHAYRMEEQKAQQLQAQLQLQLQQAAAGTSQQLAIAASQLAAAQQAAAQKLEQTETENSGSASKESVNPNTGIAFIDGLSASVRPVLTYYWCCGLYGSAKLVYLVNAFTVATPLERYPEILISGFDQQVIGSMMGFWFMDRALRRAYGK